MNGMPAVSQEVKTQNEATDGVHRVETQRRNPFMVNANDAYT